jgi:hypothetical protein
VSRIGIEVTEQSYDKAKDIKSPTDFEGGFDGFANIHIRNGSKG